MSTSTPPPTSDTPPPTSDDNRRAKVMLLVSIPVIALLVWVLLAKPFGGDDQATPAATPTPTGEVSAPGQQGGGGGGGDATEPAGVEETPEPVFGNTPAPNPTETYVGDDADHDHDDAAPPGFEPTSDRAPEPGDEEDGRAALEAIIPLWASNDTSRGNDMEHWGPTWQGKPGGSAALYAQSRHEYLNLWGGLSRMGVSALDARLVSDKQLWNVGSHSLWRVTVERDLKSNHGQPGLDGSERVTWDLLIKQDGSDFEVIAFADPKPENEKPETFYYFPRG